MEELEDLQKTRQLHEAVGGKLSPADEYIAIFVHATATSIPVKRDSASFESIKAGNSIGLGYGAPAALQVDLHREETANHFLPGTRSLVWARRAATWAVSSARTGTFSKSRSDQVRRSTFRGRCALLA